MENITPPEAKSLGTGLHPIPFGMPSLDNSLGGLPAGTATLLAGAPDAGAEAFVYTQAAQLVLAKHDPGMYDADVGRFRDALPDHVVYLSLATGVRHILHGMNEVLDQYQFDALVEHMTLLDYSGSFLDFADVPAAFDADAPEGPAATVTRQVDGDSFADFVERVADDAEAHGENSLVILDSLTDLLLARRFGLSERTMLGFLIGLREAASRWDGLVNVLHTQRAPEVRADAVTSSLLHGNIYFYSNDQGFDTYRTMRIGSFGGALDRETQVVYGTSIGPAGFRVKATKKIAPQNW
ncbi:MAG: RAD55 family ATPase [Salinirussus sp.]